MGNQPSYSLVINPIERIIDIHASTREMGRLSKLSLEELAILLDRIAYHPNKPILYIVRDGQKTYQILWNK